MPDAVIGVIIGGLIAWVAPLLTLRHSERRWRFEAKLDYLRLERDRFEKLYEANLEIFGKGMMENTYSSSMMADVLVLMPKEIGEIFEAWMKEKDKTELKKKYVYMEMAAAMKRDLVRRDSEIRGLFGKEG